VQHGGRTSVIFGDGAKNSLTTPCTRRLPPSRMHVAGALLRPTPSASPLRRRLHLRSMRPAKIHLHGRRNQGRWQPVGPRFRPWSPRPPRALNHGKFSYGNKEYIFFLLILIFFLYSYRISLVLAGILMLIYHFLSLHVRECIRCIWR
jgi:hypothetical protein